MSTMNDLKRYVSKFPCSVPGCPNKGETVLNIAFKSPRSRRTSMTKAESNRMIGCISRKECVITCFHHSRLLGKRFQERKGNVALTRGEFDALVREISDVENERFGRVDPSDVAVIERGKWIGSNYDCSVPGCATRPLSFMSPGGESIMELYGTDAIVRVKADGWLDIVDGLEGGYYAPFCKRHQVSAKLYFQKNDSMTMDKAIEAILKKERGSC